MLNRDNGKDIPVFIPPRITVVWLPVPSFMTHLRLHRLTREVEVDAAVIRVFGVLCPYAGGGAIIVMANYHFGAAQIDLSQNDRHKVRRSG